MGELVLDKVKDWQNSSSQGGQGMSSFLIQTNIPIFHHSIIPFGLQETCSIRNAVISISCRNSDTLNLIGFLCKLRSPKENSLFLRFKASAVTLSGSQVGNTETVGLASSAFMILTVLLY